MNNDKLKEITGTVWNKIKQYFNTEARTDNGIKDYRSGKFYIVLGLYVASFLFVAKDPFFLQLGEFTYKQGIIPFLLAFLIVSSLNWELLLFGKPTGANLLLQIIEIFPAWMITARIMSNPSTNTSSGSLRDKIVEAIKSVDNVLFRIGDIFPQWLTDCFSNWWLTVGVIAIALFLSLKSKKIKVGVIGTVLVLWMFTGIATDASFCLIFAMVLFAIGMMGQWCKYGQVIYYENVTKRIVKNGKGEKALLGAELGIMTRIHENGQIDESEAKQIVKEHYSQSSANLYNITVGVIGKMYGANLIRPGISSENKIYVEANPLLYRYDTLLLTLAIAPRLMILTLLAFLWVALPFDLIPDAMPFIGVLDDAAISIFTALAFKTSIHDGKLLGFSKENQRKIV